MKITKTYIGFYRKPYSKKSKLVKIHKTKKRYYLDDEDGLSELSKDFFEAIKNTTKQI